MTRYIIILISLFVCTVTSAQNVIIGSTFRTEDKTCETENTPKTILLEILMNDSYKVVKKFIINNCTNFYQFPKYTGKFRVTAQADNYEPTTLDFEITKLSKDTIVLNEVVLLKIKSKDLAEVTVTGIKKELIKIEADKTTISVKNNDMLSQGNVYDAVVKLPGILLDLNGNVILNGKKTAVWIDGQPSNLSGQDLINFLNNLPASVVEKIEIISNPGSSYDANTSGGIVNIVTTSKSLKGFSGSVTASYSRNKYNKAGLSATLNGKIKKLGWQLSAGYNINNGSEEKTIRSSFLEKIDIVDLNQNYYTEKKTKPFFWRTGLDYSVSKNAVIGVKYNLNSGESSPYIKGNIYSKNAAPDFISNSYSNPNEESDLNDLTVYYRQKIDSSCKEFNITGGWSLFNKNNFNPLTQISVTDSGAAFNAYSISNNELKIDNKYAKINYLSPFKNSTLSFNTGTKISISDVNSTGLYNFNSGNKNILEFPAYNSKLKFKYKEVNFAYYVEFRKNIKNISLNAGLRYENTKIESETENLSTYNRTYSNLFPSASMLYKLNNAADFVISYTRKIEQPGYSELDPNITGYFDTYTQTQGNANLKPNFYNNYEAKLSILKYASIGFNYNYSKTENLFVAENTGNNKTIQTYKSFEGIRNYNFNLSVPVPFAIFSEGFNFFKKKINVEKTSFLYISTGFNSYKVNNADAYIANFKSYYFLNTYAQIILPLDYKLGLNYTYASKGTYQIYQINNPIQKFDMVLSKSFLSKSLKITLNAKDIFNTFQFSALANSNKLITNYSMKTDSRSFSISLNYTFGKFSFLHKTTEVDKNNNQERIDKKGEIGQKLQ